MDAVHVRVCRVQMTPLWFGGCDAKPLALLICKAFFNQGLLLLESTPLLQVNGRQFAASLQNLSASEANFTLV